MADRYDAQDRSFTSSSLRHAYATHMYEQGADTFVLKTLLGHLFLRTTKTYVHIGIKALSDRYFNNHPLAQKTPRPGRPPSLEELEDESEQD